MPLDNTVLLIENWIGKYDSLKNPQTPAAPAVSSERQRLWQNYSVLGQSVRDILKSFDFVWPFMTLWFPFWFLGISCNMGSVRFCNFHYLVYVLYLLISQSPLDCREEMSFFWGRNDLLCCTEIYFVPIFFFILLFSTLSGTVKEFLHCHRKK